MFLMPTPVVKIVEELATIDTQFDEDLNFEDRDNIPIEDSDDTTKGATAAGAEIKTPGVEMELETPGVGIGNLGIRTPGVGNPSNNEGYTETDNKVETEAESVIDDTL